MSSVAFIAALTEAGSLTSQIRVSTLPGPWPMVAAAFVFLSALRPQIETLQPAAFSACAMPRPMPPLPPVMTAARPERSKDAHGCFHFLWLKSCAQWRADVLVQAWTSASGKSNMGRDIRSDRCAAAK